MMKIKKSTATKSIILTLALIFLYLPIMTLVVYSVNDSKMVTIWTSFSFKWYGVLIEDSAIIKALVTSLTIAVMAAATSVIIGTMAAFVMVRIHSFTGESAFMLFMTAPMVLPEVVTGLALLLLYVTLGDFIPAFADRGIAAIWFAHVTFCSAYATVVIRSRFLELDTSIEEAAKDLGAGPLKVFFAVMLPSLMPAEIAAFLLSFTMSMDDVVITSFIAGPESTTLPMLIFSSIRRGLSPEINALASSIIFVASKRSYIGWRAWVRKQKGESAGVAKANAEAKAEREKILLGSIRG